MWTLVPYATYSNELRAVVGSLLLEVARRQFFLLPIEVPTADTTEIYLHLVRHLPILYWIATITYKKMSHQPSLSSSFPK